MQAIKTRDQNIVSDMKNEQGGGMQATKTRNMGTHMKDEKDIEKRSRKTTIEFSANMSNVIKEIIKRGEARTFSEVVRNAVSLYMITKEAQRSGYRIAIVDKDDKIVKEIVMGL